MIKKTGILNYINKVRYLNSIGIKKMSLKVNIVSIYLEVNQYDYF